jgi:hypothetical protein
LQYLLFPEGILYHKQNDTVRTSKVTSLIQAMQCLTKVSEENKNGRSGENGQNSHLVARTRIELVSKV